jgi:UDP-2-acetamido-2-deoxy-ribo-hexuluronate aminotransferase
MDLTMKKHLETNIQMVDLAGQYQRLKSDIDKAMANVLAHTQFINGPEVREFSTQLGQYLNVKHVIACANGTDALQLALMALDLQPGDEIITPTFTFIATVEVIALLGLKPVLVDVDPHTFNIDTSLIESRITTKTKAILPVHLFGQGAPMDEIITIANKHNLYVIEDAAQCLGGSITMANGTKMKLGTIGHIGCTSFFPSKNLGAFGDGGACFTNNDALAQKLRTIANHGAVKKYHHQQIGINSRLDTLQAAILLAKLPHLDDFNARRQKAANAYDANLNGISQIELPVRCLNGSHIFHQYTIKVLDGSRDALVDYLKSHGVPTMVYYPIPIHLQDAFACYQFNASDFPVANQLKDQVLSLPMHTELDEAQVNKICNLVKQFFQ